MNEETNEQERSESQILSEVREWAENFPYWLSSSGEYARGYREGVFHAHRIVMSIITGEDLVF